MLIFTKLIYFPLLPLSTPTSVVSVGTVSSSSSSNCRLSCPALTALNVLCMSSSLRLRGGEKGEKSRGGLKEF